MAEKSGEPSPSEADTTPCNDDRQSSNWWDSWISSAKTKSAEVYTMVKKDLDEIGSAVKSEATHVFSTTSNVIGKTLKLDVPESPANVMKKSFSTFIGQVSTVLNPEPDDEDDTEVILSSGDTTMLSTYKKELEALQRVDATFLVPACSGEFAAWRATVEGGQALAAAACVRRLRGSPLLRDQYRRLVPDAVSHDHFWERYLFRVALLQDRLAAAARKQPIEEQKPTTDPVMAHLPLQMPIEQSPKKVLSGVESETATPTCETPSPEKVSLKNQPYDSSDVDSAVAWEDEDFANDVELTEEQQILLLEEYEKEIASKKTNKKTARDVTNNNADATNNPQTIDNMNNKTIDNKKITDKKSRSPKKTKSDDCGNLVEDYFGEKEVKDDASANSDESWEKEFELEESEQKV
ncbi:unnamed protein product [Diatraea saccharalis]|uniref:BSD domain-containing protein n=1 Tax=Diatraea saccharalis TaxID=40085 RepID=A0A9P0CB69_9NEOP|nr:unnamed protein product [Diatraea saccharalis]